MSVTHLRVLLSNDPQELAFIHEDSQVYRNGVILTTVGAELPNGVYVVTNENERTTFMINDRFFQDPTSALDIKITDISDVEAIRSRLAAFVWGEADLPDDYMPSSMEQDIQDPGFAAMDQLARIDRITVSMEYGLESIAYLFHPRSPNGRAVLYHQGHATEGFIKGFHTIESFVRDGYTVVGLTMPLRGMNNLMPLPGMSGLPKDIPTRYGPV
ncbi:MAG: hypothetical protein QGI09_08515, partial [Dehalococcoidia bacterium]|nr:hypothetical protein [Dehalococcoidia bacterium]